MKWGMNMSIDFLHGYVKFTEEDSWHNISSGRLWLEGGYDELRKIMKQQAVYAYLIELVSQKPGMLPLPQTKLEYITKESE